MNEKTDLELCQEWAEGRQSAGTKLLKRHKGLVWSQVNRLSKHLPASVDREDLTQEGRIALLDAAKKFHANPLSEKMKFSTYATNNIRWLMLNFLRYKGATVRTPRGGSWAHVSSLVTAEDDPEFRPLPDGLVVYGDVEETLAHTDEADHLMMIVNKLSSSRQRDAVKLFWGLGGKTALSLEMVAKSTGTSHQNIHVHLEKGMRELARLLNLQGDAAERVADLHRTRQRKT